MTFKMNFLFSFVFFLIVIVTNFVECQKSLWKVPDRSRINDTLDDNVTSVLMSDMGLPSHSPLRSKIARTTSEVIAPWPNGTIPFKFDVSYIKFERDLIRKAMNEIEYYSCVKFREWETTDEYYLNIRDLHLCASNVGFKGKRQTLSLSSKTCMKIGIIVHELMHTLGFIHEHSRDDRDEYVTILEDNIDPEFLHNFDKQKKGLVDHFGQEYDYSSIMHYDEFAYAIDTTKPVMEALKPGANLEIREKLSQSDIIRLNKLYKC